MCQIRNLVCIENGRQFRDNYVRKSISLVIFMWGLLGLVCAYQLFSTYQQIAGLSRPPMPRLELICYAYQVIVACLFLVGAWLLWLEITNAKVATICSGTFCIGAFLAYFRLEDMMPEARLHDITQYAEVGTIALALCTGRLLWITIRR